jgi:HTH-type transcriptional regulator, sugar sensing transcriptional regulator
MEIQNILLSIGFNRKEVQVYLAALELAEATITDIAQKAKIPRTTAYGIITSLSKQGLISFNIKKRRKYFFAENPMRLLTMLNERERLLKEAMPRLRSIHNIYEAKPRIKFYEGKEGVKTILEDIIRTKKDFRAITSISDMNKAFGISFPAFIEERIKNKINVKLLTVKDADSLKFAKKDKKEFRQTKFVPKEFSFHNANFIYGDKIAVVSVGKQFVMGVVIEDADIVCTQKMMFDIVWSK